MLRLVVPRLGVEDRKLSAKRQAALLAVVPLVPFRAVDEVDLPEAHLAVRPLRS